MLKIKMLSFKKRSNLRVKVCFNINKIPETTILNTLSAEFIIHVLESIEGSCFFDINGQHVPAVRNSDSKTIFSYICYNSHFLQIYSDCSKSCLLNILIHWYKKIILFRLSWLLILWKMKIKFLSNFNIVAGRLRYIVADHIAFSRLLFI